VGAGHRSPLFVLASHRGGWPACPRRACNGPHGTCCRGADW
jgi:hypothetical protein